jgi:hypothetical protein
MDHRPTIQRHTRPAAPQTTHIYDRRQKRILAECPYADTQQLSESSAGIALASVAFTVLYSFAGLRNGERIFIPIGECKRIHFG